MREADLWEDVVADAFTALGCEVERLGKRRECEAVPDSIVRHKKYEGTVTTVIVFVVDCKAGSWAAPVDENTVWETAPRLAEVARRR